MNDLEQQDSPEHLGVEELFLAHAAFIASFLRRLGIPVREVDDLVQDIFLIVHKKGGYVRGPAKPRSWLASIAVHAASNKRRALVRRREEDSELALELATCAGKSPAEQLELRQSLLRVQSALSTLDVEHRATFILYELENESCDTIAELLKVPVGTVYSRLHKARKKFLQAYEGTSEAPALGLFALALLLGAA